MGPLPITPIAAQQVVQQTKPAASANGADNNFATFLADAVNQASELSNQADAASATYAAGGPVSVDQLMIAEQKASLALDLVVQVRNRVVNAYQTIMNMQI